MKKKIIFILSSFLIQYTILLGKTWIVNDDGPADFNNIQEAIYAANDGDTAFVKNGAYKPFIVPSVEITIIGESNHDTKIDNLDNRVKEGITIATSKRCQISNFKLTNTAIYVASYSNYTWINTTPELIIERCVFDSTNIDKIGGIWIDIDYYGFVNTFQGYPDSLINAIKIYNNTFVNRYEAIVFAAGGIIGKKSVNTSGKFQILNVDGEYNYYGISDSSEIQKLIIDINNLTPPEEYISEDTNYVNFDFIPWSDTLVTSCFPINKAGIKYNNFINCTYAFISGLIYPSIINEVETNYFPDEFTIEKLYPNPFNPSTKLRLKLPYQMEITIKVFNLIGEEIKELTQKEVMNAGEHTVIINFVNKPTGIYFINIGSKGYRQTQKAVLIK